MHVERKHVYVLGPGAIGTYLAAMLAPHADVRVLVRDRARADALRARGLVLTGAVTREAPADAVALDDLRDVPEDAFLVHATKATALAPTLEAIAHRLPPSCPIVLTQNGLGIADAARAIAKESPLVRAACWMGILAEGPGRARVAGVHSLVLAPGGLVATQRFADLARLAGLPVVMADDVRAVEWKKALWNLAVNALCSLVDQPNGAILEHASLRRAAEAIVDEATRVAAADGVVVTDEDRARVFASLEVTRRNVNSTLQDLRAGRPTETPFLTGAVGRIGRAHGVATPLHDLLENLSEYLEKSGMRTG
jgi:2-dehydropantoate 2-reductase